MNRKPARITLSLFFTDVPPQILPPVEVGGRTRAGRLDARQVNLAYSTTMGYAV
jgi:hypothetical protein